jgi:protein TonB
LIAAPPRPAIELPPLRRHWRRAAAISAGAHVLVGLALILPIGLPWGSRNPPPQQMAQIEMVQQPTPTVGSGPTESGQGSDNASAAPPPSPPSPPPGEQVAAPLPQAEQGALPQQGAPPAPPPQPPSKAAPADRSSDAPAAVRLGSGGDIGTALVTGSNIIPAGIDSHAHNDPPAYPEDAAMRGQEGTVVLRVHIDPQGNPRKIDVQTSSGYQSLDRAARVAVARWHFRPAQADGHGVESDMPIRLRFVLKE